MKMSSAAINKVSCAWWGMLGLFKQGVHKMVNYIIAIGCNNPVDAKLLCHPDGTTKVYSVKDEAEKVVSALIEFHGLGYARLVAV